LQQLANIADVTLSPTAHKDEIIKALVDSHRFDDGLDSRLEAASDEELASFKRVAQAGGTLELTTEQMLDTNIGITPFEPYLLAFNKDEDGPYTFVVPAEMLAAWRTLDLEAVEEAQAKNAVLRRHATFLTQVHGIVPFESFAQIVEDETGDTYETRELVESLGRMSLEPGCSFELIDHDDDSMALFDKFLLDEYGDPNGLAGEVSERHRLLPPKQWSPEELEKTSLMDLLVTYHETTAFIEYLSTNGYSEDDPEGIPELLESIVIIAQGSNSSENLAQAFMTEDDQPLDEDVAAEFFGYLAAYTNVIPRWLNNGWTPAELHTRTNAQLAFYMPDSNESADGFVTVEGLLEAHLLQ
jgi:hypothetical protein